MTDSLSGRAPDPKLALDRAIAESQMAYRFTPNSYTFGAMSECLRARDAFDGPRWIDEFLAY